MSIISFKNIRNITGKSILVAVCILCIQVKDERNTQEIVDVCMCRVLNFRIYLMYCRTLRSINTVIRNVIFR